MIGGIVVGPVSGAVPHGLELMIASHPLPDARSEAAGRALLAAACEQDADSILFLISGGASALASVPAPGLTLELKRDALATLYSAGAPIEELNCARKHLSAIKGGRLAAVAVAPMVTFAVSDVAGDDLSVVGSGPSVADPTTFDQALAIFERYVGIDALAPEVRAHLHAGVAGEIPDTPSTDRPGDRAVLLAGMRSMVDAGLDEARRFGYDAIAVDEDVVGEVRIVADRLVGLLPDPGQVHSSPRCFVACGEATIALPKSPGQGGRAQHIALLVAKAIAGRPNLAVLVCGTDGIDGRSDAAGAVVCGDTWAAICGTGIDPDQALARADAGTALAAANATVVTGPTGVNHADLMLVLCGTE